MSEFDNTQTPSGGETPDTSQATTQSVPAPQQATPVAPQPPASGGPPQEGWVPSYRIREAREAAVRQAQTEFAQREQTLRAESERYRQQLHQLVGVTPPADPQVESVRQQFARLYPGLAKLEEKYGDIEKVIERAGDYDSQLTHYWQSYGQNAVDRLFSLAKESTGGELTPETKRIIHSAFSGFVSSSPELEDQYARDPKFVDNFWRAFSSGLIDPVRRTVAASAVQRVAGNIPQDTPGGVPRSTPPPGPQSIDERAARAWAMYEQTADPNKTNR